MADVKWIKIVTDIFDDEKMLLIEQMPDGDAIIVIWFKLLCLAGKQNNRGVFTINDKIPFTDEMFATIFRKQLGTVRLALTTFERFGMVEVVNSTITIPNWGKHQNIEGMEKRKEYNKNWMKNFRDNQKLKLGCGHPRGFNVVHTEEETEEERRIRSRSSSTVGGGGLTEIEKAAKRTGLPWYESNQEQAASLNTQYGNEWLIMAMERANRRGKISWGYVESILGKWKEAGQPDSADGKAATDTSSEPNWVTPHD